MHFKSIQINEVVELLDLFPTLTDLVRLPSVPTCPRNSVNITLCTEGHSMVPLINNAIELQKTDRSSKSQVSWKNYALNQYPRPGSVPTSSPNFDKPKLREIKIMGYSVNNIYY